MGIECIDLDTALKRSDCIVIIDEYGDSDIRYKLEKMDINQGIIDLYDIMLDEPSVWCEDLEQYKNIHKGERCFIIGNGPSLKPEDLDILRASGEVCFATNDIGLMYDKTEWRPDYYVVAGLEQALVDLFENRLDSLPGTKFTTSWYQRNTRFYKSKEYHYFSQQAEFRNYDDLNHHLFSMDASKRVFECYTVVYTAFQLAAYMGFSEIYLLGVDNGGKGYFFQEEDYDADFLSIGIHHNRAYRFERDWEEAEWYSRNHGFRLYNATRGGYLEIFERVDFDSLF